VRDQGARAQRRRRGPERLARDSGPTRGGRGRRPAVDGAGHRPAYGGSSGRQLGDRILNWGASAEEAGRQLPGDELLEDADIVATRAITIEAPPAAVWPWLVQMGPGRAGAYIHDWIENLFGLNMHSADEIHPEWQQLEVGDLLRSRPGSPGMRVAIPEREGLLSNRSEAGDWVWTLALHGQPDGSTRLLNRNRIAVRGSAAGQRLGMLVMEPGSLVTERKMLLARVSGRRPRRRHEPKAIR
jgi:hypothetical protein